MKLILTCALILVLGLFSPSIAQVTDECNVVHPTELYIPIGQSPGISGISSKVGTIVEVTPVMDTLVIQVAHEGTAFSATLTRAVPIFLDFYPLPHPNFRGNFEHVRINHWTEVAFCTDGRARWIKIKQEAN